MPNPLARAAYRLSQTARVVWYGGHHVLANRLGRRTAFAEEGVTVEHDYPKRDAFFRELQALFERDWKNVEQGIYAAPAALDTSAIKTLRRSLQFLRDVPEVARRRRDNVHDEVLRDDLREKFPRYYLQNFHYQSGGWLTEESAKLYDFQVETLFTGTADAMTMMSSQDTWLETISTGWLCTGAPITRSMAPRLSRPQWMRSGASE